MAWRLGAMAVQCAGARFVVGQLTQVVLKNTIERSGTRFRSLYQRSAMAGLDGRPPSS